MQEFIKAQEESVSPHKRMKCPKEWCNKVFTSVPGLKYHIQTHCSVEPKFSCQRCHKVFKRYSLFTNIEKHEWCVSGAIELELDFLDFSTKTYRLHVC